MARRSVLILVLLFVCRAAAVRAASSGVLIEPQAPGHASGTCTRYHGEVNTATGDPTFGMNTFAGGIDVSATSGLGFWCKGDGGAYQVMIHQEGHPEANDYRADFTPPLGWSYVELSWSDFAHPGWGAAYNFDYHQLASVSWMALTNGNFDISVEDLKFVEAKTTPIRTVTPSIDALQILDLVPVPNPGPNAVAIQLASPADRVELKLYSVSGACLHELALTGLPAGWTKVPLPADWDRAPLGLNLLRASASRGAHDQVRSKVAKFFVLR